MKYRIQKSTGYSMFNRWFPKFIWAGNPFKGQVIVFSIAWGERFIKFTAYPEWHLGYENEQR